MREFSKLGNTQPVNNQEAFYVRITCIDQHNILLWITIRTIFKIESHAVLNSFLTLSFSIVFHYQSFKNSYRVHSPQIEWMRTELHFQYAALDLPCNWQNIALHKLCTAFICLQVCHADTNAFTITNSPRSALLYNQNLMRVYNDQNAQSSKALCDSSHFFGERAWKQ